MEGGDLEDNAPDVLRIKRENEPALARARAARPPHAPAARVPARPPHALSASVTARAHRTRRARARKLGAPAHVRARPPTHAPARPHTPTQARAPREPVCASRANGHC